MRAQVGRSSWGFREFRNQIGCRKRAAIERYRAAFAGQLVGKDLRGFGADVVPAAPALNSVEYAIELVELYWASLLRDVSFTSYDSSALAHAAANELTKLSKAHPGRFAGPLDSSGSVTPENLFRGGFNYDYLAHVGLDPSKIYFAGELAGPYVSQFWLMPTNIGRVALDQKITTYASGRDFMTRYNDWEHVQNGGKPKEHASFDGSAICAQRPRHGRLHTS